MFWTNKQNISNIYLIFFNYIIKWFCFWDLEVPMYPCTLYFPANTPLCVDLGFSWFWTKNLLTTDNRCILFKWTTDLTHNHARKKKLFKNQILKYSFVRIRFFQLKLYIYFFVFIQYTLLFPVNILTRYTKRYIVNYIYI